MHIKIFNIFNIIKFVKSNSNKNEFNVDFAHIAC